jgi:hypothetical protein
MITLKARCAKYVGVPFLERGDNLSGWDCWGMLHYVGVHELSKDWPTYREAYGHLRAYEPDAIAEVVSRFLGDWRRIPEAVEGCAVSFDKRGDLALRTGCEPRIHHVGLVLNAREMLHVQKGAIGGTVIVPFDDLEHRRFIAGFWERS